MLHQFSKIQHLHPCHLARPGWLPRHANVPLHKTIAKPSGAIASGEKISDRAVLTMFFASCILHHPFHIEYFPKKKTLRRWQCKVAGELERVSTVSTAELISLSPESWMLNWMPDSYEVVSLLCHYPSSVCVSMSVCIGGCISVCVSMCKPVCMPVSIHNGIILYHQGRS